MVNISPSYDSPTEYSRSWNQKLLETELGDNIDINLIGDDATRENFVSAIDGTPRVIHFGHGSENALIGQNSELIVDSGKALELKDKKVYTMSCLSAKVLGVEAYKRGCKEYWGAIEPIGFVPEEDELFGEVYNLGAYQRFYEKLPIKDVLKNMEDKFNENMDKAVDPWTRVWLRADRDSWRCWSDETPPPEDMSNCVFRSMAVRFLGRVGWKIPNFSMLWYKITHIF